MLGDLIIWIKEKFKQQTCIHKYSYKGKLDFRYESCDKCGKLRD